MNPEHDTLSDAMDYLTPHETEPRHWNDVIRRADYRRRRRWILGRVVPAVGIAAAASVLGLLFVRLANTDMAAVPAGLRDLMERPQTDQDRTVAVDGDWLGPTGIDPDSVRLLREANLGSPPILSRFYFGLRRDDGAVCFLTTPERLVACSPINAPAWQISYPAPSGGQQIVGLAAGNYTRARIGADDRSEDAIVTVCTSCRAFTSARSRSSTAPDGFRSRSHPTRCSTAASNRVMNSPRR